MTVIAWDGKTLAADKRTGFGGLHATTTKVHRIGQKLVGCAGNTAQISEMVDWFRKGADAAKLPEHQKSAEDCVSVLVIDGGKVLQYENTAHPIVIEDKFWAIGSGRDFAMTAMYLGKTAKEAVEIASVLCAVSCGNGVDVIETPTRPDYLY